MDWLEIVKVVQLKTLFQNWDAFKGTVEAAGGCLEFYAFLTSYCILQDSEFLRQSGRILCYISHLYVLVLGLQASYSGC